MSKDNKFINPFEQIKKNKNYNELKINDPISIYYEKNEALKPLIIPDDNEEEINIGENYIHFKTEKKQKNNNNEYDIKLTSSNVVFISERSCPPDDLILEKNIILLEKAITKAETNQNQFY